MCYSTSITVVTCLLLAIPITSITQLVWDTFENTTPYTNNKNKPPCTCLFSFNLSKLVLHRTQQMHQQNQQHVATTLIHITSSNVYALVNDNMCMVVVLCWLCTAAISFVKLFVRLRRVPTDKMVLRAEDNVYWSWESKKKQEWKKMV